MRTLEILEKLVAFPSISDRSNLDITDFCRAELSANGFACRLVPDATGKKANLFATIGPPSDDGILLSGHMDVVPVDGQTWSVDPFRLTRRGDRLLGRGTTDMKGFLAAVVALAPVLGDMKLRRPLHIAFSHDEEIACVGVRNLLEDLRIRGFKASLALIGEPTSMQPMVGHKGKLVARASSRGTAGHSAEAPHFLNAIHLACEVVGAVRATQARLAAEGMRDDAYTIPYTTLHTGRIRGGDALNVVAETASVEFEIRHLADDDPFVILAEVEQEIEKRVKALVAGSQGCGVEIAVLNAYPGLHDTGAASMLSPLLSGAAPAKISFGTEAGLFAQVLAIPSLVMGPGNMADGHKPDESIAIDQLIACDAFLNCLLRKLQ